MENKFEHIEDIIAKFLAGEASPQEKILLEEWRNLSEENKLEFSQFEKIFSVSSSLDEVIDVNTDVAWANVKRSMQESEQKGKVISIKSSNGLSPFLRIAAVLLLFAGLGIVIYFLAGRGEEKQNYISSGDSVKMIDLPDGSKMTLNRNSSIAFATSSFSKKRVIKLEGEAFFNVKHDSLSPFIVETSDLRIKDVGTAFNVNSKSGQKLVIVTVTEGEVQLTTSPNNSVFVSAGEEATYNSESRTINMSEHIDPNISAYKDKIFVFENAELSAVMKVLNEIYDVKLEAENEDIQHCRITVTFNNEQIDVIADVISETLGLTLKKENDKIIFSGNGCK